MSEHQIPAELTAMLATLKAADLGGVSNFAVEQLRDMVGRVEMSTHNASIGHPPVKADAAKLIRDLRGKHRAVAEQARIAQQVADALAQAIEHGEALEARL